MMHTVTLHKSNEARYKHLSYVNASRGVIGPLLRRAVKEGLLKEDDMVVVLRGDTVVFNPCEVRGFSDYDIREGDRGLARVKHKPFDMGDDTHETST